MCITHIDVDRKNLVMKIVNVLMSTYNGEQYVGQQIESILEQERINVRLYIRDDGSSDRTVEILQQYANNDTVNLVWDDTRSAQSRRNQNRGYGYSFLKLLHMVKDGDYWAFSDQDDVWMPDKLVHAIGVMESGDSENKPLLYCHRYELTDSEMHPYGESAYIQRYSFAMAITECSHMGFATVMNRSLRTLVVRGDYEQIISHDWWTELVAMEYADVIEDDYVGAKHRRLEESVSSSGLAARFRWLKKAWRGNAEIANLTNCFMQVYGDQMRSEDKSILSWFIREAKDRYPVGQRICKSLYIHRWRSSLSSEFVLRFLMLMGKV